MKLEDRYRAIDLTRGISHPALRRLVKPFARAAEWVLAAAWVNRTYERTSRHIEETGRPFFSACLDVLDLGYEVNEPDILRIPAEGPVMLVANHPFGGADAIVIADLASRYRSDSKVMANSLLTRFSETDGWIIPVDPFGGPNALQRNLGAMRQAVAHLKSGGLLAVFPAGEVSSLELKSHRIRDKEWSEHVASLARRTGATVVPVYFEGRNTWPFQLSGVIHPALRTLQLPRQLRRMCGKKLKLRIGKPIAPHRSHEEMTDRQLVDFYRLRIDVLAETHRLETRQRTRSGKILESSQLEPLAEPQPPELLRAEVESLPAEDCLMLDQDGMQVWIATAEQIPQVLREIGRLREVTFRKVGEGTGKSIDLDAFDETYLHIFLWNREAAEIAGAYRLGPTDRIMAEQGLKGLYTRSLFKFKPGFIERLDPALELGRSFIVEAYQRKLTSLLLLWRGITRYIARNPRYRILYGPVSISQDYHALSRNLLVKYMREQLKHPELSKMVRAPNPPDRLRLRHLKKKQIANSLTNIEDVSALISEIEADGKGVPILIKHYVRMSAALLSFNVDKGFGDVIDGLIVVDLYEADPKLLGKYMGVEELKGFRQYHARLAAEEVEAEEETEVEEVA